MSDVSGSGARRWVAARRRLVNQRPAQVVSLALMGAGLVGVAGSIGPWAHVHLDEGGTDTVYGLSNLNDADGRLTAPLMAGVFILAVGQRALRIRAPWMNGVILVAAALVSVIALGAGTDLAGGASIGVTPDRVKVAWGVWAVGVAALVALVAVLADLSANAARRRQSERSQLVSQDG